MQSNKKPYQKLSMIGEGTYGKVFLAKLIATQEVLTCKQIVAIKKIRLDKHSAYEGIQPTTLREISLLKELNHPNIVCLKDVLLKSKHIYLIFEYVKNDLHSLIVANKPNTLKKEEAKSIIYQLLKAISYMHKMGILHRDVKPQNILVSNEGVVKIADFGLARFAPEPQKQLTREVMTLWYRAPEIMLGAKCYSTAIDVWSIGCVFAEIIGGGHFLAAECEIGQLFKIFECFGTPSQDCELASLPEFKMTFPKFHAQPLSKYIRGIEPLEVDLLEKMLRLSPSKRISVDECLNHKYFDGMNKSTAQ